MIPLDNVGRYLHLQTSNIYQAGKSNPQKTLGRTSLSHLEVTRAYEASLVYLRSLGLYFISCKSVRGVCAKWPNLNLLHTIKRPLRSHL